MHSRLNTHYLGSPLVGSALRGDHGDGMSLSEALPWENLILPILALLSGQPPQAPTLSYSVQKALHSFLAFRLSKISMLANWLELNLQCLLLHSPNPCKPQLPSVSPTVDQETQNLKIQGLPSVSEGTLT